jgi:phenylalanyl-tRNA synthetase beta chain
MCGLSHARSWHSGPRDVDFFDVKGAVETLASLLDVAISFAPTDAVNLHRGRRAAITVAGTAGRTTIGWAGELSPAVAEGMDIGRKVFVAELDLDEMIEGMPAGLRYEKIAKFPALKRDIAVIVPDRVPEADVREVVLSEGGRLVRSVELFDVYKGEQIPEGTVSLAYSIVFQSEERTLQEDEVNGLQKKIEDSIANRFGGKLRSD